MVHLHFKTYLLPSVLKTFTLPDNIYHTIVFSARNVIRRAKGVPRAADILTERYTLLLASEDRHS